MADVADADAASGHEARAASTRARAARGDGLGLRLGPVAEGPRTPRMRRRPEHPHEGGRTGVSGAGAEPTAGEDLVEGGEALVDPAADEELVGGAGLEVVDLAGLGEGGGLQEGGAGVAAAAGVGQGLGQPQAEAGDLEGQSVGRRVRDAAIEGGGAVEGEGVGGVGGGLDEVAGGVVGAAGRLEVDGQGLGVGLARGLQLDGEAEVAGGEVLGGEAAGDGLADAVVVGLDLVEGTGAPAADEVVGAQVGQGGHALGGEVGGAAGGALADRLAGHGDRLQQPPGAGGQADDATPEPDLVEAEGAGGLEALGEVAPLGEGSGNSSWSK